MNEAVLFVCFGVAMAGVVGCVVGAVLSVSAKRVTSGVRRAVAISAFGATPSLLFVVHVLLAPLAGSRGPEYELWTFLPALSWILVGPFVFLRSFAVARPLAVPRYVDALRAMHLAAWAAASVLVMQAAVSV